MPLDDLPNDPLARFGPSLVAPYPELSAFRSPGLGLEIYFSREFGRPTVPTRNISLTRFE